MAYVPICPQCKGTVNRDDDDYVISDRATVEYGSILDEENSEFMHATCYEEYREEQAKKVSQA